MPATSASALNSWGLYLISAAALVLVLTPHLIGLLGDSRESSDYRAVDGVRAAIDGLHPGVKAEISLGTAGRGDPIVLGGNLVSCDYGGGLVSASSRWPLPNFTLRAAVHYLVWLSQGRVEVAQAV